MTRKLLPYEYDLIDALGVSKEEYLDFVAQQHIYEDQKQGTALDVRNGIEVAIAIAIVGILFQVASILLMPRPKAPKEQQGTPQTRDAVLAPRIGFNGAQDLAVYGDIVPLVYTNTAQNANGGVRVASLLLWSAILSFGNNQFMRLMMIIGASSIAQIDPERTALGQFPAKDLVASSVWQYFNEDGASHMVDVGGKAVTERMARAEGFVLMKHETLRIISDNQIAKGDVLEVARLAGIMSTKRTDELILWDSIRQALIFLFQTIKPSELKVASQSPVEPEWKWKH